jgi:hypothetical protein
MLRNNSVTWPSPYRPTAVAAGVSGMSKAYGQDGSPAIKIGGISAATIAWRPPHRLVAGEILLLFPARRDSQKALAAFCLLLTA